MSSCVKIQKPHKINWPSCLCNSWPSFDFHKIIFVEIVLFILCLSHVDQIIAQKIYNNQITSFYWLACSIFTNSHSNFLFFFSCKEATYNVNWVTPSIGFPKLQVFHTFLRDFLLFRLPNPRWKSHLLTFNWIDVCTSNWATLSYCYGSMK